MTQTAANPSAGMTLQDKFRKLKNVLSGELIERTTVIDTQLLALVAGAHHFQLGEPGVAKSLSTKRLLSHIEPNADFDPSVDFFEVLMTRFSNPEEIFGPLDLQALQNSSYKYQTKGYLPEAKLAFLDEIWKANASILNALLWALNERIFRNDGAVHDIPLWSMFCASNEMPEGEELNALYDRIHFRIRTRRIQEPGNFIKMLKLTTQGASEKIVTWGEIEQAAQEASVVAIPDDVFDALIQVKQDLKATGIEPTDRRFNDSLRIVRAEAWMNGYDVADIEHLRPLAHVLWSSEEEQPIVEKMLLELANPLDKDAMTIMDGIEKLSDELERTIVDKTMDDTMKNKKGVELHGKVRRAKDDLEKLKVAVEKSGRKSAKVDDVQIRLFSVTKRLLVEVFNLSPDEVAEFE